MAKKTKSEDPPVTPVDDLSEVELRFVDEYLIDRDPAAAALRAGVARINLKRTLQKWLGDPRIARTIQLRTDVADLDKMISPQRIMAGFIEVAFDRNAPPAARNTALRELASIKKMYGEDDKNKTPSGIMFVPAAPALADWAKAALEQQTKLKDQVKD